MSCFLKAPKPGPGGIGNLMVPTKSLVGAIAMAPSQPGTAKDEAKGATEDDEVKGAVEDANGGKEAGPLTRTHLGTF